MMKTVNSISDKFVLLLIILLASLMAGGCDATVQSGLMTRLQPAGGEVVNPWISVQERKFRKLDKSFQEQIARAEKIDSGSVEVQKLKSEYQKVKQMWELRNEEMEAPYEISILPDTFVNSAGITMKLITPGSFMDDDKITLMRNSIRRLEMKRLDRKMQTVAIETPFYIGVYEVTGKQWSCIMGGNGTPAPQNNVSWDDAIMFCERLSEKEGMNYTLPTEIQWEYACRAGTKTTWSFGDRWNEAASRQPNAWGLYDMHGNLWELCRNWYDNSYNLGILRGGSWECTMISIGTFCRVIPNNFMNDSTGFRIVLLPD